MVSINPRKPENTEEEKLYLEYINRNLPKILDKYPYFKKAYDSMVEYLHDIDEWRGLFIITGDFPDGFSFHHPMSEDVMERAADGSAPKLVKLRGGEENEDWIKHYIEMQESLGNALDWDSRLGDLYKLFGEMAQNHFKDGKEIRRDGGFAFDYKTGRLVGGKMYVNNCDYNMVPEITMGEIGDGTKHVAAAYASMLCMPSVVGGHRTKQVRSFYKGYIPEGMRFYKNGNGIYIPHE